MSFAIECPSVVKIADTLANVFYSQKTPETLLSDAEYDPHFVPITANQIATGYHYLRI